MYVKQALGASNANTVARRQPVIQSIDDGRSNNMAGKGSSALGLAGSKPPAQKHQSCLLPPLTHNAMTQSVINCRSQSKSDSTVCTRCSVPSRVQQLPHKSPVRNSAACVAQELAQLPLSLTPAEAADTIRELGWLQPTQQQLLLEISAAMSLPLLHCSDCQAACCAHGPQQQVCSSARAPRCSGAL